MKESFPRRHFLSALGVLAGAAALPLPAWAIAHTKKRRGVVLGNYRGMEKSSQHMLYELRLLDLDSLERRTIPLSFFAHGIAFDPRRPQRAVLFEKRGPGACAVDLAEGRVVRPLTTASDRAFYGHGAFSKDGKILFASETVVSSGEGVLSIWDADTLKSIDQFSTFGSHPHDCSLIDDGKTLVVTNGGGAFPNGDAPSVTFIDVQSRKLIDRLTFTTPRINAGHVLVASDRTVAVSSAPRDGLAATELGALSLGNTKGLHTMVEPIEVAHGMVGETLSLALHEPSGHLAVTSPTGNQLSFWDLPKQKLVKSRELAAPRGVTKTLDGSLFVVSFGASGSLGFYSATTLAEVPSLEMSNIGFIGSHLYSWAGTSAA